MLGRSHEGGYVAGILTVHRIFSKHCILLHGKSSGWRIQPPSTEYTEKVVVKSQE
jgi:hypothetical protein